MIEHKDIPDGQRHEPKGISTATSGQVYKADGSGGGTWGAVALQGQSTALSGQIPKSTGGESLVWRHIPSGWGYYKHSTGTQSVTSTYSKLNIDGGNANTNTSYLPYEIRGTGNLWDTVNSKITPISEGDSYDIRLDLEITAESGNPTELTVQLDIGVGSSPTVPIVTKYVIAGKSTPYTTTVTFPVFCLNTFKTNGGQFFVKTDTGTATITNRAIALIRTSSGDF